MDSIKTNPQDHNDPHAQNLFLRGNEPHEELQTPQRQVSGVAGLYTHQPQADRTMQALGVNYQVLPTQTTITVDGQIRSFKEFLSNSQNGLLSRNQIPHIPPFTLESDQNYERDKAIRNLSGPILPNQERENDRNRMNHTFRTFSSMEDPYYSAVTDEKKAAFRSLRDFTCELSNSLNVEPLDLMSAEEMNRSEEAMRTSSSLERELKEAEMMNKKHFLIGVLSSIQACGTEEERQSVNEIYRYLHEGDGNLKEKIDYFFKNEGAFDKLISFEGLLCFEEMNLTSLLPQVALFQKVTTIDLSRNLFSEFPRVLLEMENLSGIDLSNNPYLSSLSFEVAKAFPNLKSLILAETGIAEDFFSIETPQDVESFLVKHTQLGFMMMNPEFDVAFGFIKEGVESEDFSASDEEGDQEMSCDNTSSVNEDFERRNYFICDRLNMECSEEYYEELYAAIVNEVKENVRMIQENHITLDNLDDF